MRQPQFINFALIIITIISISSCGKRLGDKEVRFSVKVLEFQGSESIQDIQQSLKSRMLQYGVYRNDLIIDAKSKNELFVYVKGIDDIDKVMNLAETQGKLEFWRTYEFQNLMLHLQAADSLLWTNKNEQITSREFNEKNFPLTYGASQSISFPHGSSVIFSDEASRDNYLSLLETSKDRLPEDLKVLKGVDLGELAVHFLKYETGNTSLMKSPVILRSHVETDSRNLPAVMLEFDTEDAEKWKRITGSMIGKQIAMAFDDEVFMAPMVHSEIPNGACQISGNFSFEECRYINVIIKYPISAKLELTRL
ncbi:MAG: hypothetical protein NXI20_06240 [bacterium]|nr:hypothetical protein [bacterium]